MKMRCFFHDSNFHQKEIPKEKHKTYENCDKFSRHHTWKNRN